MVDASIVCDNVTKQFKNHILFDRISVTFKQGNSYAIQGVSGTGKSTFLSLIGYLDTPTLGTITFNGKNLNTLSSDALNSMRMDNLGYMFQHPHLIKEISVLENVQLPGFLKGTDKDYCKEWAYTLLSKMDLEKKADEYPGALSGGELQRVTLARALFNKPAFLIADEPTAHLDQHAAQKIMHLLTAFQQEWNMGIIMSTHDTSLAHFLTDHYQFFNKTLVKQ